MSACDASVVMQRPDDGKLVGLLCLQRIEFGDVKAVDFGFDRIPEAPIFGPAAVGSIPGNRSVRRDCFRVDVRDFGSIRRDGGAGMIPDAGCARVDTRVRVGERPGAPGQPEQSTSSATAK